MEGLGHSPPRAPGLLAACPEPRPAALMCECQNANLGAARFVDDSVWKPAERETPSGSAPLGAQARVFLQKLHRALKLRDEGMAQFGAGFAAVEECTLCKFSVRLRSERDFHASAWRAR